MSRTMKIRKLKLFYFQKNARYRAKELCRNIFLGNLSLNEGKISVGLPVLILEFWWRHVKTKNKNDSRWTETTRGLMNRIDLWDQNTVTTPATVNKHMALLSDNYANPPNHKWHSVWRNSSAKKKLRSRDTVHFIEKRVFFTTCNGIAATESKTISLSARVFHTSTCESPRRPRMKTTTQVRNASWLSVVLQNAG